MKPKDELLEARVKRLEDAKIFWENMGFLAFLLWLGLQFEAYPHYVVPAFVLSVIYFFAYHRKRHQILGTV